MNTATQANVLKRVAIVGGVRIPFCRSNSAYAQLSNLDMLSDTLQSLVSKYSLDGKKIDEVIAGAVTTHSRDWNLTREAILSTSLAPSTPGTTLQMACGTSLQAAMLIAGRIASGQIECGIAAGTDTTSDAPLVLKPKLTKRLLALSNARGIGKKISTLKGFSFSELAPQAPQNAEPRTGLSMGQHCELMAKQWGINRADQDQLALASHLNATRAYDEGFFDDLVCDYQGVLRDNNIRSDSTLEKLSTLAPVFDRSPAGTLTAGNSTSLTDGSAAVFLVSEEYAIKHDLPVSAWLNQCRTSAVDFVGGDGLLMAPTRAVSELLQRSNMSLQDFAFYEIHEAFAAQVLCTLKAWEDRSFCQDQLGLSEALGSIDRSKLNIHGSSLAMGHPFAATGARILSSLSKDLSLAGSGYGLVSICTAGGMGAAAILSGPNS